MNAQLYFAKNNNLLVPLEKLILSVLNGTWQSTDQINNAIKNSIHMLNLSTLLIKYNKSGFSTTSSFVGSIASNMSNLGAIHHTVINNEHFFKF